MIEVWRRLAHYLLIVSTVGVGLELVLLEHYADPWQWAPLALLTVGLAASGALALGPTRARVRALRMVMVGHVLAGALGIFLHLRSNVEFELELRPSIGGRQLAVETLRGAIPALAPGAMAQLGLLGLLVCFRHPVLEPERGVGKFSNQET